MKQAIRKEEIRTNQAVAKIIYIDTKMTKTEPVYPCLEDKGMIRKERVFSVTNFCGSLLSRCAIREYFFNTCNWNSSIGLKTVETHDCFLSAFYDLSIILVVKIILENILTCV